MDVGTLPDLDRLDNEALKALVVEQTQQVEHLKLVVEKFRRMIFGAKSEKAIIQVEQFELQLEETETEQAAAEEEIEAPASEVKPSSKPRPSRKPLPAHLPREVVTHHPGQDCCPDCGGQLRNFGEDVAEILEYIPANFKVIRHVRPKFACKKCERVVEASAPSRTIERGLAGPGLLAHVLVAKYADHCPLFRQSEIYAREGVDLDRSTLAGWVGAASELLTPLVDALRRHVLSATKIHADDTPVPVLAPGNGKTKTGRLWTYVRDERSAGENTSRQSCLTGTSRKSPLKIGGHFANQSLCQLHDLANGQQGQTTRLRSISLPCPAVNCTSGCPISGRPFTPPAWPPHRIPHPIPNRAWGPDSAHDHFLRMLRLCQM